MSLPLPTNFKDDQLNTATNTHRRYAIKKHSDNTTLSNASDVYLQEITSYTQNGTELSATVLNEICTLLNGLSNNGQITAIQVVNSLPAQGVNGTLYLSKS